MMKVAIELTTDEIKELKAGCRVRRMAQANFGPGTLQGQIIERLLEAALVAKASEIDVRD